MRYLFILLLLPCYVYGEMNLDLQKKLINMGLEDQKT